MLIEKIKLSNSETVKGFDDLLRQGMPLTVFGVADSFKSALLSTVNSPVLFVVKDMLSAATFKELIGQYTDKKVRVLPPKDELLMPRRAFSKDALHERISVINELSSVDVLIAPVSAVMQSLSKEIQSLKVFKNQDADVGYTIKKLTDLGYKRVDEVEGKGFFSVRGDVIDVFPVNCHHPVKVDFFGDTIENIRKYEPSDRKCIESLDDVEILSVNERIFSTDEKNLILDEVKKSILSLSGEAKINARVLLESLEFACEKNDYDFLSVYASAVDGFTGIGEFLPKNTVVVFDEPKRTYETGALYETEFFERFFSLMENGNVFPFMEKALCKIDSVKDMFKSFRTVAFQTITGTVPFFNPLKTLTPATSSVINYRLDFKEIFTDVKNWLSSGYTVVICTGTVERSEKLCLELSSMGIASAVDGNVLPNAGVLILSDELSDGFILHERKLVVVGSGNLYAKPHEKRTMQKKRNAFFTAPEVGDYAVHEIHGIGRVLGNKRISTTEGTKDYIAVEYFGGDVLYIPVEQMDLLTRYLGAEKHPKLSKIGGKDFDKIKNSVKESIKKMSFDLKKLYEERSASVGFKFNDDKEMQDVFESAFEFEDTPDQTVANDDIKADMTSDKVMDRLVCGDVGFGKTEVAFRAIFRAIVNGKQAVMLAPTTILTEQHYSTAVKRFNGFGIRIACLNRFRTSKEQKKILDELKNGEIDFVIGTHRLLGKDVEFKNLGLLVLDEEQRFGVEHKEKIKLIKNNVDTLTLTATPIPRTLHMSLSGIRSISTINTPPKKRLPVQTYVTEETDITIKDAISREINRGGQVFLLYNRVESIFSYADKIKRLLPNLKITVAHGQMDERTLENNILDFYQGKTDILISTTIIENGIDLPRANTLIVIDADTFGLSTLYQLKGRVGRSDRLAYAYFTFNRDKVLTDTAYHRLNAIIEFTEMGSGIKIAMRDLEIRGAGNVLGAEQHGHMEKIGYELYSKLLREELEGDVEENVELDVRVDAFIPENYIESNVARMDVYKEIAEIDSLDGETEVKERLFSTYGIIPRETENLFNIALIKRFSSKIGAKAVFVLKDDVSVVFSKIESFGAMGVVRALEKYGEAVSVSMTENPKLKFKRFGKNNEQMLKTVREFLSDCIN